MSSVKSGQRCDSRTLGKLSPKLGFRKGQERFQMTEPSLRPAIICILDGRNLALLAAQCVMPGWLLGITGSAKLHQASVDIPRKPCRLS